MTNKNIAFLAENYVPASKGYEWAVSKIETMEAALDIMRKLVILQKERGHKQLWREQSVSDIRIFQT